MSILVALNIVLLSMEYFNQAYIYDNVYDLISITVITIFSLEIFFKLTAQKLHFFRNMWNTYDFFVTIFCIIGILKFILKISLKNSLKSNF